MLDGIFLTLILRSWALGLLLLPQASIVAEATHPLSRLSSIQPTMAQAPPKQSSPVPPAPKWIWGILALTSGLGIGISAYCFGRASVSMPSKSSTANASPLIPTPQKRQPFPPKTGPSTTPSSIHPTRLTKAQHHSNESIQLTTIRTVESLVETLHNRDPQKRRQAIWELGQQGTSEAIAPLVSLMATVDSQQRSLILGSISEIGIRTIQPLNRALVISLQDNNPDVRKNAIRDITRIYGLMTQISQILCHAAADDNEEVRTTAHWALGQFNRMYQTSALSSFEPSPQSPSQLPNSLP
ncbi:MAG: HEAT repeat domain-containing protein [Merismopedia sp. SIO2A8]|nr:HEAT repeat domain-containing protein [Merismopedia sp. SIO2A8]